MNTNDQFRNYDLRDASSVDPNKVRIEWSREVVEDDSYRTFGDYDGHPEGSEEEAQAKERWEAHERGEWSFVGIRAQATIHVPIGGNSFCTYMLTSAGLWGVESDSGEEYLNEVFEEEKASLTDAIKRFHEGL